MIRVCIGEKSVYIDQNKVKYPNNYIVNYAKFNKESWVTDETVYIGEDHMAFEIFCDYVIPILYNEIFDVKSITYDNISYIRAALKFLLLEPLLERNIDDYYKNINTEILQNLSSINHDKFV
ncbi:hypothetical protein Catovirus_1_592 [Catovirus CTV1]|uniref:Uncharacterized protein n=1 Tax=Catovirus CTV1 TaxID=1977631 RepID=A0A1V0SA10_9VIRU|nr:hypothetical protein Catovirus_1_592 [Catovirus CTV1]